jgi:outer membrane protein OmpA-like peptidoglycan-associated protein
MARAEAEARKLVAEAQAEAAARTAEAQAATSTSADLKAERDGLEKTLAGCQATTSELQGKLEALQQEARQRTPVTAAAPAAEPAAAAPPAPQPLAQAVEQAAATEPAPAVEPAPAAEQTPAAPDRDGDGIPDAQDLCPDSPAGAKVNELGCQPDKGLVLEGVQFKSGTAELEPGAMKKLDQVAASLAGMAQVRVEVAGYTDSVGDPGRNQQLSVRRAQAVVDYLAARDVARERLTAKGYGQENPIADNATAEGRSRNRRVELHPVR